MKNQALILLDTVERLGACCGSGCARLAQPRLQPMHLQALLYLNEANR
jgi:hypothetical protein